MVRKPKQEIKYACESCDYVPEIDEKKSNENWKVIPAKCPKCGGNIQITFDQEERN